MGDNSEPSPSSRDVEATENGTADVSKDSLIHMKHEGGTKSNESEQTSLSSQVSR